MKGFAPKRQFSQNFLTDVGIARNIVAQLHIEVGDHVLEVGPGKGALTKLLLETSASLLHAVDLDPRALDYLHAQSWVVTDRLKCTVQDALQTQVGSMFPGAAREHRKIIGNIPYAITSDLVFWAFSQHRQTARVVYMMQREVAKRCVAQPGTKDYGILSVATWLHSEAKIAFHVQPGSFFPRPEVTSSVIAFSLRETLPMDLDAGAFMDFVRAAFSQRRKVLSNALASWGARYSKNMRTTVGAVDLTRTRAEELTPELLAVLYLDILKS